MPGCRAVASPTAFCRLGCSSVCGTSLGKCTTTKSLTGTGTCTGRTVLSSACLKCRICSVPRKRRLVNVSNGLGPGTALNCSSNACCCAPSG